LNSQNVTDATAEQAAYNAAESGIQSAVNVLRGNVVPNPLLDATKPATDKANKIDFIKALRVTTSNLSTDTTPYPRFSRWLGYHGTCTDRVVIGATNCDAMTGYAYALSISDPDNTGTDLGYTTTGTIFDHDDGDPTQITYGTGANRIIIKYYPVTVGGLDVSAGATSTNFGNFKVTIQGTGASIPSFNRFEIVYRMTKPYAERRVIRGYIETNASASAAPKIIFDAQTFSLMGSVMTLGFSWGSPTNVSSLGPPQRYGYEALMTGSSAGSDNIVTGTVTSPEPTRLLLKSTGYGPRGSTKRLEAIIQKDLFSGLWAPATLTLVGPPSTTTPASSFIFNPGSSAVTVYSGDDIETTDIIPPIGTTNQDNLDVVEDSVNGQPPHPFNGSVIGSPANVELEIPDYLSSPSALDSTIRSLATIARSSGRFFPNGTQPPNFGDNATGTGITFCDGNCELSGNGGGMLVVTGTLTLKGNFNFRGLIIVTGPGGVQRSGGGNGLIQGNIVVAPYVGSRVEDGINPLETDNFLSPSYDLSGGGNSTVQYNSNAQANGLIAVSNFVLGVMEK
jgi:hypothetical protein